MRSISLYIIVALTLFLPTTSSARAPGIAAAGGYGGRPMISHNNSKNTHQADMRPSRWLYEQAGIIQWSTLNKRIPQHTQNSFMSNIESVNLAILFCLYCCTFTSINSSTLLLYTLLSGHIIPIGFFYGLSLFTAIPYFKHYEQLVTIASFDSTMKALAMLLLIGWYTGWNNHERIVRPTYKPLNKKQDKWVRKAYIAMQEAISNHDINVSRTYLSDQLFQTHQNTINQHQARGITNKIDHIVIRETHLCEDSPQKMVVKVTADIRDYEINQAGNIISGSKNTTRISDTLIIKKADEQWTIEDIVPDPSNSADLTTNNFCQN